MYQKLEEKDVVVYCGFCDIDYLRSELKRYDFGMIGERQLFIENCPRCKTHKGLEYPEDV